MSEVRLQAARRKGVSLLEINYIEALVSIVLATFGGLVKRMTELEKTPDKRAPLQYYLAGSLMSAFVGIVVYFICKYFDVPQLLVFGLTALAGYMGVPVLDMLSNVAKKKIATAVGEE